MVHILGAVGLNAGVDSKLELVWFLWELVGAPLGSVFEALRIEEGIASSYNFNSCASILCNVDSLLLKVEGSSIFLRTESSEVIKKLPVLADAPGHKSNVVDSGVQGLSGAHQ
jgi:hypothetical protein